MSVKKGGLGRGLDAIFAENTQESGSGAVMLRISELEPNREQPRKDFDEKVRIGTTVFHLGDKTVVQDIRRREHLAQLAYHGWLRCSEFDLVPETGNAGMYRKNPNGWCKPVKACFPDGTERHFDSLMEAARAINISIARASKRGDGQKRT